MIEVFFKVYKPFNERNVLTLYDYGYNKIINSTLMVVHLTPNLYISYFKYYTEVS